MTQYSSALLLLTASFGVKQRTLGLLEFVLYLCVTTGAWSASAATNRVFSESMAANATNSWTGKDCDNAWSVGFSGSNPFAQGAKWNYGDGNLCGLQFKQGTSNLADNTITTAGGILATGTAAYVEFYLSANGLGPNTGWAFQLDAGSGFSTRLSETAGLNHAWRLYHYDLQPEERVGNLRLRFQFAGGAPTNRINLDQISLSVVTATSGFDGSLVLGRPTANSVTINALANTDFAAYFEYGKQSGAYGWQTAASQLRAHQPLEVVINSLQANTRYYYRLRFKNASSADYLEDVEHTFMTQRAPGSTFTFCLQGDSHPERTNTMFDAALYARTLLTAASDQPDFYVTLGDDFSVDNIPTNAINAEAVTERYTLQRPWLGLISHSAPLFLVNGNHEQAAAYLLDGTSNNIAVWAQNARNQYYPEPAPDGFYTGNAHEVPFIGLLRNYYAWTWGDALFVTLDPYWADPVCVDNNYWTGVKRTNLWDVTHGDAQYQWLKTTLEQSTAKYKFVFAHHVLGTGRGGIEEAGNYEWGGRNGDGSWGFTANRPDWVLPLHQLMASNHVTIFFQGHDHLFARQQLDGVTYLTLPNPADPNYSLFNSDAYTQYIWKTNNSGYVRITVSPETVQVDYVRTFLPADEGSGKTNGMVGYRFALTPLGATNLATYDVLLGRPTDSSVTLSILASDDVQVYVEYGTESGVYPHQTPAYLATNGIPLLVTLSQLQPNQQYYYRLCAAPVDGTSFNPGLEHTFYTQRARGSTFTFDLEADPHYGDHTPTVWQQTLTNILRDQPDFLIDLGDTFMGEKYASTNPFTLTQPGIREACAAVRRQFFGLIGHSVPLYLVNGNHDPELGWWLDPSAPFANPAVWGSDAREFYYPCPIPGGFYSGATAADPYQATPRDGYYAFEWGDALLVILDPFWYSNQGAGKPSDPWAWTLGSSQYYWLKSTLENSAAKFKFVFAHQLVGGSFDSQGRGGLEFSPYFEWGGLNPDGSSGFAAHRPGWPMPIRDLLLTNQVQVFFHGHDHLYVKQDYYADGVSNVRPSLIYQEVPQPSHFPYEATNYAAETNYNYRAGVLFGSSGHLRITVSPSNATVEYVRAYRPSDVGPGKTNGMVSYVYQVPASSAATNVTNLALTGAISGENLVLHWNLQPGLNYTVQWSSDLVSWEDIYLGPTNRWMEPHSIASVPRRFYRVNGQPPFQ